MACALISPARAGVDRPPQFVVMAFDNCTELDRWQELTDFAAQMNRDGDRLHFTFFVSGINYIADASRNIYEGPHQRRGTSRINFGGTPEDIRRRVDYVNGLYRAGHEIGSHAIGHFNGKSWSTSDWDQEFRAYSDLVKNVGANNGLDDLKLAFRAIRSDRASVRRIWPRAPRSIRRCARNGFRYDTSGDSGADEWPAKIDGIWRFNLARLKLQGIGREPAVDGL